MNKNIIVGTVIIVAVMLLLVFLSSQPSSNINRKRTMYVGPITVECEGATPQRCYQVRENPNGEYVLFYDQIEEFEYEAGYDYKISVEITDAENQPEDTSDLKYKLIEVLEKSESQYIKINFPEEFSDTSTSAQVTVNGEGRGLFEGNVVVEAQTRDGQLIAQNVTTMNASEIGKKGNWSTTLNLSVKVDTPARIIAKSSSPKDGSENIRHSIRVTFKGVVKSSNSNLEGHEWKLKSYQDENGKTVKVKDEAQPNATFVGGQVNGSAGCNNYFGSYSIEGTSISFGPLGSARMACAEEIMQVEFLYLQNLELATTYKVDDTTLVLSNESGEDVLIYTRY